MITVDFKFDIDSIVESIIGDKGFIVMAAIDDNRSKTYYIQFASGNGAWIKENKLKESQL